MKYLSSTLASAALVTALALATAAEGQTVYIATQRAAPYIALAGGQSVFPFGAFDSAINVPLGFTFNYFGQPYDTVSVTENGAIALQATCSRFNPTCDFDEFCNGAVCERGFFPGPGRGGFPNLATPSRLIAPFWGNLFYDQGNNPLSDVRVATVGGAPNREFVVEWRNIRHEFFGGSPQGSRLNFQARLSEATGNIRFHYGPFTAGQDAQFVSGYIGIQSGSNDFVLGSACTSQPATCNSTHLQQLQNQIIELGRPTGPELTGTVTILAGAEPGGQARVAVTARNVGLQATPSGFVADVYLGLSSPIVPTRDTNLGRLTFAAIPSGGTATATLTATIPGALAIGRYTTAAYIDAALQITEATEANNIVEATDTMLVGADLIGVIEELPSGDPGQAGFVEARLVNLSSARPNVAWQLYLSNDGALDAGDTLLSSGSAGVTSGGETVVRPTFTFPNVTPGYYQLLFVVDPANLISEVDEFNNVGPSAGFILGPELQGSFVSGPARTGPGETVDLQVVIDSLGAARPAVPFSVWLSRDTSFNPAIDVRIAQDVAPVPAGSPAELVTTATIPAGVAPGTYHLILDVDPANVIAEFDEGNNIWIANDTIQLTGPDISSVALGSDAMAFRSLPFAVTATFENVGGQTVRDVRYSFHLSVNQLITVTDPRVLEGGPLTLRPGERVVISTTATIAADFATGQYYIGVIADSDSAVTEQDESNNIRRNVTRVIVRDVAPDFLLTEIVTPQSAAVGERVTIQRRIENVGNDGGEGQYEVRLVPVGGPSADGFSLGRAAVTLASGGGQDGVDTLLVPTNVPSGDYEVEYTMDPGGLVDELDERNNVLRGPELLRVEQAQLEIVTKYLPVGAIGVPYVATLVAQGGVGATTWRLVSGDLPAGLTLAPTGRISGSPTAEARARFFVEVSDGATRSTRELELLVAAGQASLDLITRSLPAAYAGQPYEYPLVAVGGIPPYEWSYEGELAPGFVLTSSGALSGVAEAAVASRVLTFRVVDARGDVAERPLAFRVLDGSEGVRFGDGALPDGVVGESYEAAVAVAGGEPPLTFGVSSGELPPGLALDGSVVRGTPLRAGAYTIELRVTDGRGNVDLALFVISVSAPGDLRFVTTGLPAGLVNQPYTDEGGQVVQLRVLAPVDSSSVTVRVASGALPAGLTLDGAGRIRGTPTAAGVSAFVAEVTDGEGRVARGAFGISITSPAVIEPPPAEDGGCGCSSASPVSGGAWALLLIGVVMAQRRRVRRSASAPVVALLVAGSIALATGAEAQRPPIRPPPPPSDGGVGPGGDGGTGPGTSRYFFSERAEAYSERTGGVPLVFPSIDDSATLINLPFPFRLFEDDYTSASIGTNGYVSFVSDASSLGNSVFPEQFEPNAVIAAFWDDLYDPTVTTHLEGTAPTRVFVIQWANTQRCCGGNQVFFNFQIHLHEGPAGRMELHYGARTGAGMEFFDASVGFEDATGSRGFALAACSPNCSQADMIGFEGNVFVALQDAGEDVFATSLVPEVRGIGRVYQGVPFTVRANYASYHGQPIGPFVYRVHLLARGQRDLTNPVYTSPPVTLTAYEQRDEAFDVILPLTVAPGRYTLALQMDADAAITEPDENNNVVFAAQEVIVAERGPNFTAASVAWQGGSPVAPGTAGTVTIAIENSGNLDGVAAYRVVLSGNPVASLDDLTLASGSVPVALLQTASVDVPVTLPATLAAGEYWVGLIVDPDATVAELSEIDNVAVSDPMVVRSGPLAILTSMLPPAYRGLEYAATLVADGIGIDTWTVTAGALPEGVALSLGGAIAGRPTTEGSFSFTVEVRTRDGDTASRELTLEVRAPMGPLVIVTRQLLPGVVGQAYPPAAPGTPVEAQQRLLSSGGAGPVTFRLVSGAPDGLVLDADGYLHGATPRRGVYPLVIEARAGAEVATATLELVVVDAGRLTVVPQGLPEATVGVSYRAFVSAVGVVDPARVEFALVGGAGALPDGLSLSTDGTITGTASVTGRFVFSVRATEVVGARVVSDTASFEIEVVPSAGFAITPASLPDATVGVPYTATLEARLGRAPFVWGTVDSRLLPRGLRAQVVMAGGVEKLEIAGTPEELPIDAQIGDRTGGIATFRVSVTDSAGQVAEAAYAMRVLAPPPPPPPPTEEGGCSCASSSPAGVPLELAALALSLALVRRRRRAR